ncbi:hypothetical protein EIP91_011289, partial [Steccherinum ochraceum]
VYIIETAQQFWSELEETIHIPPDCTLQRLDLALKSYVTLCSSYHELFLQSPMQIEHSSDLLLSSELFTFHSERMSDLLLEDARTTTDPHVQLIVYTILLAYGRRNANFLRSHKRWQPIIPLLMDHVRLEYDPDVEDMYTGVTTGGNTSVSSGSGSAGRVGLAVPIETKLRSLSLKMLYEILRVQKLSLADLQLFDDGFLDHLFDLVEQTRGNTDDSFNYAVIKFIVALNEQFMLASLPDTPRTDGAADDSKRPEADNRVLRVLMSRLGSSVTFGENMIFMLNRANRTPEDRVMQLLVLKILYLLFTTKGTSEYFYTNDLCVLVDVFLREIVDLDETNESLRHTYLRIIHVLESLIGNAKFRDINPTTKRLVQRCLGGDWCIQYRQDSLKDGDSSRTDSPGPTDNMSVTSAPAAQAYLTPMQGPAVKSLKSSRSFENLKSKHQPHHKARSVADAHRHNSNDSAASLPHVASAAMPTPAIAAPSARRRDRNGSVHTSASVSALDRHGHHILEEPGYTQEPQDMPDVSSLSISPEIRVSPAADLTDISRVQPPRARTASPRRAAPPPPTTHRRKPPAVPSDAAARTRQMMTPPPALSPLSAGFRK